MPNYETPGPISVTLDLGVGDVRIAASDRADTVVEVRPSDEANESDVKAAQQVRVDYTGGMLRITGPKSRGFDSSRKTRSVDVAIGLPNGSRVSAQMQMGDIHCAGRLGECRLKTSAGNFGLERTGAVRLDTSAGHVTAGTITGHAEISTGSGKVEIGEIEGTAVVRNSNGNTTIGAVTGDVQVRAANGDICVERAGADVDAKTSNGSVRLSEVARGSVVAETGTGDVEIGIAQGTGARLAVNTGFGHVHNQLENAAGPQETGQIVEVRGHTSYGDITIHRS